MASSATAIVARLGDAGVKRRRERLEELVSFLLLFPCPFLRLLVSAPPSIFASTAATAAATASGAARVGP